MRWLILLLLCVACAPQSTRPFEPTEKQNIEAEIPEQSRNQRRIKDDCYEIYKALAAECGYSMTMQCKAIRRDLRRIGRTQTCKLAMNRDDIARIFRAIKRR